MPSLPQRRFIKGLNAATPAFEQPPGTVPRISNLLFTKRGGLSTTPGSATLSRLDGVLVQSADIRVLDIALYQPNTGPACYVALITDPTTPVGPPANIAAVDGGVTGTFADGTYNWTVTGVDSGNHETTAGVEAIAHIDANHNAVVTWDLLDGAALYNIYRRGDSISADIAAIYFYHVTPGDAGYILVTLTASVPFAVGGRVAFTGLTGFTALNGKTVTINAVNPLGDPNQFTAQFTWVGNTIDISPAPGGVVSIAYNTHLLQWTKIRISTPDPHGLVPGQAITLSGVMSTAGNNYNADQIVDTVINPNAFTVVFYSDVEDSGGGGTIVVGSGGVDYGPAAETGTASGGATGAFGKVGQVSALTFTDTGATPDTSIQPPDVDTTQSTRLIKVTIPTYDRTQTLKILPAVSEALTYAEALGQVPAGPVNPAPPGVSPPTPSGGVVGGVSEIPQLLQFNDKIVACLGNGHKLQVYDGTTVVDASNSFIAVYPSWAAATAFPTGALIQATIGGTTYVFKIQQGGTTATASDPTAAWPTGLGQTVVDGTIIWVNAGLVTSSAAPPGAAHGIIYAGSLWIFNTAPQTNADKTAGPCCLQMSDLNTPGSWNPLNVAFIGKDDGTEGTGLASFTIAEAGISPTGSLVAFKDFTTYQVIGVFGAPDFQIIQSQTDMGCIAPRSIQFLPGFGIARLTHLGVSVFDGVRDRLISAEIYPYLFGGEPDITPANLRRTYCAWGTQSVTPPMYLLAIPIGVDSPGFHPLTRILCYDLVLKAWTIVDLPFAINCLRQIRISQQGSLPITLCGGWADGSIRRLFADDAGWQDVPTLGNNSDVNWTVRTPEVFGKSAADRLAVKALYIKGAQPPSSISAQLTMDSSIRPLIGMKVVTQSGVEFEALIQTHQLGKNIHADINGSGPVELHSFDWDVEPQPSAPAVLV